MKIKNVFDDGQDEISYLPLIVRYAHGMPNRRWEALPGVTLMRTSKTLKKTFDNPAMAKFTIGSGNYAIRVDKQRYLLHAKKRLHQFADGQSSDFCAQKIAKNLLLAVSLECPNAGFIVGGHFHGSEENGHFITRGYSNIPSGVYSGHEELFFHRVSGEPEPKFNKKDAVLNFCRLEQYFLSPMTDNTVFFKCDPIAVAAQGIWTALATPYDDQAFITFAMVLEALLTTSQAELTMQIAERAAVLVGKSPIDRYELYRSVKRLYGIRSKLVHGSGIMTKKKMKKADENVNIHPGFTHVPSEALREIGAIAIRVLRAVLHDDTLYDLVQKNDQAKLEETYVTRLLS